MLSKKQGLSKHHKNENKKEKLTNDNVKNSDKVSKYKLNFTDKRLFVNVLRSKNLKTADIFVISCFVFLNLLRRFHSLHDLNILLVKF